MFEIIDGDSGEYSVRLTEGVFSGIIYSYGRVELEDIGDKLVVRFQYNIHDHGDKVIEDQVAFRNYIGDILVSLINDGVHNNSLVYTGGVDEN